MTTLVLTALIHQEHGFVAECPELGISTSGRNPQHALGKLKAESEDYLYSLGPHVQETLEQVRRAAIRVQPRHGGVLIRRFEVTIEEA